MRVIGMISGTSFDAIEAVAMNLSLQDRLIMAELLGHVSVAYAPALRHDIEAVLPPGSTTVEQLCQLDTSIGQSFADVAAQLGEQYFAGTPDVVCSHGQTVFHWVNGGQALGTLQLGQGAWIAERTGATVVFDVRSRDVAAGGHGAPLASLLDVLLLGRTPSIVRGALNLGGIANITVVSPTNDPIAFDIGPSNALIDAAVSWLSEGKETFDVDGRRAAQGRADGELLAVLLADPYYRLPTPKSTGKEHFHLDYLKERLGSRQIAPDDLVATLTALTAETVANAVSQLGVVELFASGGGTRNPVLMREIGRRISPVKLSLIDEFGVPEAAKEAVLFAIIGFLTVQQLAGSVASCTGARESSILGAIIPGRQELSHLAPDAAPTGLSFLNSAAEVRG